MPLIRNLKAPHKPQPPKSHTQKMVHKYQRWHSYSDNTHMDHVSQSQKTHGRHTDHVDKAVRTVTQGLTARVTRSNHEPITTIVLIFTKKNQKKSMSSGHMNQFSNPHGRLHNGHAAHHKSLMTNFHIHKNHTVQIAR